MWEIHLNLSDEESAWELAVLGRSSVNTWARKCNWEVARRVGSDFVVYKLPLDAVHVVRVDKGGERIDVALWDLVKPKEEKKEG